MYPDCNTDLILTWLASEGYSSGILYDDWMAYWTAQSGLSEGTLYDHMTKALSDSGYTGTLYDKFNAWLDSTGTFSDRSITKMSDISDEDAMLLEDGDGILLETGDNMLKE